MKDPYRDQSETFIYKEGSPNLLYGVIGLFLLISIPILKMIATP